MLVLPPCSTFSNDSHVRWSAGTSETIFKLDTLRLIVVKFGSNWFSGFREEDFLKSLQTDHDRRQVMAIAHLAFWSGELKKGNNSGKKCQKIVIIKLEIDLDIHKIHIHTTPRFNPTFCSQVIIQKPIWDGRTDDTHYYNRGTMH